LASEPPIAIHSQSNLQNRLFYDTESAHAHDGFGGSGARDKIDRDLRWGQFGVARLNLGKQTVDTQAVIAFKRQRDQHFERLTQDR
jgi:hypothetical protein